MEELDLKELIKIFWSKKIEIIVIMLIFAIIGGVYSYSFKVPKYKSSTILVLATLNDTKVDKSKSTTTDAITQTEVTLNSSLVSTYSELVKSKSVLREVINNLELDDLNEEQLKKDVKVSSVSDTELIEISVVNTRASYAKKIANEIAKKHYNINHTKDIIIFAFIGLLLAVAKVLITNMLDNTIKNEHDVEDNTGLLVLAQIPKIDLNNIKKGGRR